MRAPCAAVQICRSGIIYLRPGGGGTAGLDVRAFWSSLPASLRKAVASSTLFLILLWVSTQFTGDRFQIPLWALIMKRISCFFGFMALL